MNRYDEMDRYNEMNRYNEYVTGVVDDKAEIIEAPEKRTGVRKVLASTAGKMILISPIISILALVLALIIMFKIETKDNSTSVVNDNQAIDVVTDDSNTTTGANDSDSATSTDSSSVAICDNLYSMKIVSSDGIDKETHMENTIGEELNNVIGGSEYYNADSTFYLGKNYTTLSFDISCPENSYIEDDAFDIIIYANNDESNILYSKEMSRISAREHVELDVTDVEFVTIKAKGMSKVGYILSDSHLE